MVSRRLVCSSPTRKHEDDMRATGTTLINTNLINNTNSALQKVRRTACTCRSYPQLLFRLVTTSDFRLNSRAVYS